MVQKKRGEKFDFFLAKGRELRVKREKESVSFECYPKVPFVANPWPFFYILF